MTIGGYTFTNSKLTALTPTIQNWYDFVGTDPNDAQDYEFHSGPPPNCVGGPNRCAVKAQQDTELPGNYPNLEDPNIIIRNHQ